MRKYDDQYELKLTFQVNYSVALGHILPFVAKFYAFLHITLHRTARRAAGGRPVLRRVWGSSLTRTESFARISSRSVLCQCELFSRPTVI